MKPSRPRFGVMAPDVDVGRAAADDDRHHAELNRAFFDKLRTLGIARPGQRALDIGTGSGTMARGLAGLGLDVTGVDPSPERLAVAEALSADDGPSIAYQIGRAESLPWTEARFDLVTVGHGLHGLDRQKVAAEILRVLAPRGRIVVAHFGWLSLPGNVVSATKGLVGIFTGRWTLDQDTGIYPEWLTTWQWLGSTIWKLSPSICGSLIRMRLGAVAYGPAWGSP